MCNFQDDADKDDNDTLGRHRQGGSSQGLAIQGGQSPGPPRIEPYGKKIVVAMTIIEWLK